MRRALASTLLLLGAAAVRAQPDWTAPISDPGQALERSTAPAYEPLPASPAFEPEAPFGLVPPSAEEPATAPGSLDATEEASRPGPPPLSKGEDASRAPGRIIRGRGGHPYTEYHGGGVIIDEQGRRLEVIPMIHPLSSAPPPAPSPSPLVERWVRALRLFAWAGAAASLALMAWLWRRRESPSSGGGRP